MPQLGNHLNCALDFKASEQWAKSRSVQHASGQQMLPQCSLARVPGSRHCSGNAEIAACADTELIALALTIMGGLSIKFTILKLLNSKYLNINQ